MPAHHSLTVVKARIRAGDVEFRPNALQSAMSDFAWGPNEIAQCLLRLQPGHYFKTEPHTRYPHENTMMDYYKAEKIMDSEDVYTHIYIRDGHTTLTISSFKYLFFS